MITAPTNWNALWNADGTVMEVAFAIGNKTYYNKDIVGGSLKLSHQMYNGYSIGNACAAMLKLTLKTADTMPAGAANATLKVRLKKGTTTTAWVAQGTYYLDTAAVTESGTAELTLYDGLALTDRYLYAKGEVPSSETYPKTALQLASAVATLCGLSLDQGNKALWQNVSCSQPEGMTCRQILQAIAAAAGGNWTMTKAAKLHFVPLSDLSTAAASGITAMAQKFSETSTRKNVLSVSLHNGEETYERGAGGFTLDAECTFASEDNTTIAYNNVNGKQYQGFKATRAMITPLVELGDLIEIAGARDMFVDSYSLDYQQGCWGDLASPMEDEVEKRIATLDKAAGVMRINQVIKDLAEVQDEIDSGAIFENIIDQLNAKANDTGGWFYYVEGQGVRTYDRKVTNPAVGAEATQVVEIKGGNIRIANSKDANGNWQWKTVLTSGHIAAELVTAAALTAGYIGNVDGTYWDLDNNKLVIGNTSTVGGVQAATLVTNVENSVSTTGAQYYLSTSSTTQTGGSWGTTMPTVTDGKYLWERQVITKTDGTTVYTTPVLASAINSAQSSANSAATAAGNAQTTANGAATAASNAQTTADNAATAAGNAQSTANGAATAASNAQTTADNAVTAASNVEKLVKAAYGTSSTGATTQTKAVVCTNFSLYAGALITVKFSTASTYTGLVKLNVNSTGAKDIWVANAATSSTNQLLWGAGATITFKYDGTQFQVVGDPRSWYGKCSIAAGTAAKTDSEQVATGAVICKGATVSLGMTNENTAASPTLNIAGTGAKNLYAGNGTTRPTTANGYGWKAASTADFLFDGAYWRTADSSALANAKAAQTEAANAATAASNAQTAANNAQTSADNAQTTANNAQTSANNAQDAADAAQGTANTANERATACRGTCATSATTAAKVVTSKNFGLITGATVTVYNTTAQTLAEKLTLNVNSTGAKDIWVNGAVTSSTNQLLWAVGSLVTFTYDGTQWRVEDPPGVWFGTESTVGAGVAAKTTNSTACVIRKGSSIFVPMTNENTNTTATLNVQSLGAKNVYYGTTTTRPTTANGYGWTGGSTAEFVFDGAYWRTGDSSASKKAKDAADAANDAAKVATNYLTFSETTGLDVGYTGTSAKARVTGSGFEVFNSANSSVAYMGLQNNIAITRVGLASQGQFVASGEGWADIRHGSTVLAHFGYGEGNNAEGGKSIAPYYTVGKRKDDSGVGNYSHAEGYNTTASGFASHAEGKGTTASSEEDHAEGSETIASGGISHAEGFRAIASGGVSHAEGSGTIASGGYSHAEGYNTTASGFASHAGGLRTVASGDIQTVIGMANIADNAGANGLYALIVGNGTSNTARSNALTLDWRGNLWLAGRINVSAIPSLDASIIGSGTFAAARIPDLAASKITSGTLDAARIPNLNTSKLTAGTLGVARGGTGLSTITSGSYLVGNGTGAVSLKTPAQVLSDIGAASASSLANYLPLTGGTLTGALSGTSLTMSGAGTFGGNLLFGAGAAATQYYLSAKTPSRNARVLFVGGGKKADGDANGTVIGLGAGGLTLVGGGEYATNRYNVADLNDTDEQLYLGADGSVCIESNGNTIANRKTWTFANNGTLTTPGEIISTAAYPYAIKDAVIDTSAANNGVTANQSRYIRYLDKNNAYYGWVAGQVWTNGNTQLTISARNIANGTNVDNAVSIGVKKDGTRYVTVSDASIWRTALNAEPTISNVAWTVLPLDSASQAYSTAQKPIYSRWGRVVTVMGSVQPKAAVAAGGTLAIGTLPAGCRPKIQVNQICQGSERKTWLLQINNNGTMVAARYRDGSTSIEIPTGAWLTFCATFLVA